MPRTIPVPVRAPTGPAMMRTPITVSTRASRTRSKAGTATRAGSGREAIAVFHLIEQCDLIGIESLDEFGASAGKSLKLLRTELFVVGSVLDASLTIAATRRLVGLMPLRMIGLSLSDGLSIAVKRCLLITLESKLFAHGTVIVLNIGHHGTGFRCRCGSRSFLSHGRHRGRCGWGARW